MSPAIAYLNNFPETHLGGGEAYLLHVLAGARDAGMDVTVLAMPGSGLAAAARAASAQVIELDLMRGSPVAVGGRVADILRSAAPDILHGTGYYTNMIARVAGRRLGAKVVNSVLCEPASTLSFRTSARDRLVQWMRATADDATAAWADAIVANSEAVKRGLVRQGIPEGRVEVIPNAIDVAAVRAEAARGELPSELSRLGYDAVSMAPGAAAPSAQGDGRRGRARHLLVTVGRLEAVKGLDVLFDAVTLAAASRPCLRVVIAGEGEEGERLSARIAADATLSERVLLAGYVPSAPALMAVCAVYCLPSLSEGLNTTILEAMALGRPVVATSVGGAPEVIEDGVSGRLVPPRDPRALARAIESMLSDAEGARRMGDAGRAVAEARFDVAPMVGATLGVYARVLEVDRP